MAGYVDTQVGAYRKVVGEALAGKGLRDGIRQLQEKSKVGTSLKALPARGAITAKRQIGRRAATGSNNFTEISRSFYTTLREVRSSSGVFVIEYYNVKETVMDAGTFTWLDFDPEA